MWNRPGNTNANKLVIGDMMIMKQGVESVAIYVIHHEPGHQRPHLVQGRAQPLLPTLPWQGRSLQVDVKASSFSNL